MTIPIFLFLFIELVVVAYKDIKYRKIKNYWSILNIACASVVYFLFPDIYPLQLEAFQFSIVFIFVGFMLYMFNVMGGGDSKFLASFFLLVPYTLQVTFFYFLLLSTIVIGVFFLIKNTIHNREELFKSIKNNNLQGVKNCFGTKFAYAPVILLSWIYLGWVTFQA